MKLNGLLLGIAMAITLTSSSKAVYPSVDKEGNPVLRADEDDHIICPMGCRLSSQENAQRNELEIAADERAERAGMCIVFPERTIVYEPAAPANREKKETSVKNKKQPATPSSKKKQKTLSSEENWLSRQYNTHPVLTVLASAGIMVTTGMLLDFAIRGKKSLVYKIYIALLGTDNHGSSATIQ